MSETIVPPPVSPPRPGLSLRPITLVLAGIALLLLSVGAYFGYREFLAKPQTTQNNQEILEHSQFFENPADTRTIVVSPTNWHMSIPAHWFYAVCPGNGDDIEVYISPSLTADQPTECVAGDPPQDGFMITRISGGSFTIPTSSDSGIGPQVSNVVQSTIGGYEATQQDETVSDGPTPGTRRYVYILTPEYTDILILQDLQNEQLFNNLLSSFAYGNTQYVCPDSEWVDCMPGPDVGERPQCSDDYLSWAQNNCPGFSGAAY